MCTKLPISAYGHGILNVATLICLNPNILDHNLYLFNNLTFPITHFWLCYAHFYIISSVQKDETSTSLSDLCRFQLTFNNFLS